MSYRIDAYSRAAPAQVRNDAVAGAGQVRKVGVAAGGQAQAPQAGDRVNVSTEARRLAEQQATASAEKVNKLRDAIENGTFKVDHEAISQRIVNGD